MIECARSCVASYMTEVFYHTERSRGEAALNPFFWKTSKIRFDYLITYQIHFKACLFIAEQRIEKSSIFSDNT